MTSPHRESAVIDGLPMRYIPRRFFAHDHAALEAAVGPEKYAEILYDAGYKSARFWCEKEAKTRGLTGMAVFEHYLERLSQRGWGCFSFIEVDAAGGSADIRLDHSAFVLAQAEVCAAKTCYLFSGWFAGAMDWVGEQTTESGDTPLQTLCCETQCGAEGHDHCIFAVRPKPVTAAQGAGGHVAMEGNCVGKAQVVFAHLREHRFTDL